MKLFVFFGLAAALLSSGHPAPGQVPAQLSAIAKCRLETDDQARLHCYDAAAAALETATASGNLVVVDREDVRRSRRALFGFSLPKLPFFKGDDSQNEEQEQIETTIMAVADLGHGKWQLDLGDNGIWRTTEASSANLPPKAGQSVKVRKGALGSYFVTVAKSRAVKGIRIR